ncbi:MAG: DUF2334 domain-containing protein [Spirochaetales bacterium]|nr:DUF2334 domain-containing protein [Spirochaetales bacterium]
MTPRYLFRMDDAAPGMDRSAFDRCLGIFREFDVRPIVGIVPDNRDPLLVKSGGGRDFWETMARFAGEKIITTAQHGLHHVYHRHAGSLLRRYGFDDLSEFAGLPFDVQLEKIRQGREILSSHGLAPSVWMAPNHSFDGATLKALAAAGFAFVTDGIGLYPYKRCGLTFYPVLSGKPRRIPCGMTTICLHPNTMTENDFISLRSFFAGSPRIVSFEEAIVYRPPWFAPVVNVLCRIAFFLVKTIMRLRWKPPLTFSSTAGRRQR